MGVFLLLLCLFVPFEFLSHFFVQIQNGLNIVLYCFKYFVKKGFDFISRKFQYSGQSLTEN